MPPEDIKKGSRVHAACCSWSAGQDIQHTPAADRKTAKEYAARDYRELIEEHYKRLRRVQPAKPVSVLCPSSVSSSVSSSGE